MAKKNRVQNLDTELAGDAAELQAVADAEAAIADTTDGGDDAVEAQALADAQAAVNTDSTVAAADSLKVTDFNMVSNDAAKAILEAKGKQVLFEEPEDIRSNSKFQLVDADGNLI